MAQTICYPPQRTHKKRMSQHQLTEGAISPPAGEDKQSPAETLRVLGWDVPYARRFHTEGDFQLRHSASDPPPLAQDRARPANFQRTFGA